MSCCFGLSVQIRPRVCSKPRPHLLVPPTASYYLCTLKRLNHGYIWENLVPISAKELRAPPGCPRLPAASAACDCGGVPPACHPRPCCAEGVVLCCLCRELRDRSCVFLRWDIITGPCRQGAIRVLTFLVLEGSDVSCCFGLRPVQVRHRACSKPRPHLFLLARIFTMYNANALIMAIFGKILSRYLRREVRSFPGCPR